MVTHKMNALKRVLVSVLILMLCFGTSIGEGIPSAIDNAAIIEEVVEGMKLLAQVPRPSHHEEKISAFFMNWAKEQGFEPIQDEVLNVMFDVPATAGMEDKPLVILQAHMDMVAVYEIGKDFDPLNDPITIIWNKEENTLTADGTSLGADDGAGCSIAMAIAKGKMAHGPIRILLTTNEEDGMTGALHMQGEWLANATYLINLDDEASNEVLVSTASGDTTTVSIKPDFTAATGDLALNIELDDLNGGHSGEEIDKGHLNAIRALAAFLKDLDAQGIDFELATFSGGTAHNAIPATANCVIVIASDDEDSVKELADQHSSLLEEAYAGIEENIHLDVSRNETVPPVVQGNVRDHILQYLTEIIDGVYTMSADLEGLVESSSNLGVASLNEDGFQAINTLRSSVSALRDEILNAQIQLAKECRMNVETVVSALPWTYEPDSRLLALACDIYRNQNGEEIDIVAAHAGLECGCFATLNPDLDMISIGPDLTDVHTTDETFHLDTLPKIWRLLEGILASV